MRILEVLLAMVAVACVHDHPTDPRRHDAETFARSGLGAWVKVTTSAGTSRGELISVDGPKLHVYSERAGALWVFDQGAVSSVDVYPIADIDGIVNIRALGGLAMIPQGWWLPISLPLYLGITAAAINSDIDPIVRYPAQPWGDLAKWARFPQGLPDGVGLTELRFQRRSKAPEHAPPPPPQDAGTDATATEGSATAP